MGALEGKIAEGLSAREHADKLEHAINVQRAILMTVKKTADKEERAAPKEQKEKQKAEQKAAKEQKAEQKAPQKAASSASASSASASTALPPWWS